MTGLASHRGRGAAVAGAGRRGGRAGPQLTESTEMMRNRITSDLFYNSSDSIYKLEASGCRGALSLMCFFTCGS